MRKFCFLSALLILSGLSAMAQNSEPNGFGESISLGDVLVPQGRQTMMEVMFHFNEGHDYVSYQFTVSLPDGISLVTDDAGVVPVTLGDGQPANIYNGLQLNPNTHILTCYSNPSTPIGGTEGVLVRIPIEADEDIVTAGDELEGSLTGVEFTHNEGSVRNPFDNVTFTIKVTEDVILDENYTWIPYATSAACDLKVTRTIKAGNWSSICFPFAMSADKLKAAFGDDYDLEEFTGYDVVKDGDNVVGITMNFTKNTKAARINTPYIIKTSQDISEFEVNAKVNPGNAKKSIVMEDEDTGEEVEIASMTGTYAAGTVVPKNSLFLSGNKFYYSAGKSKMKAFRAYFTLNDVLADVSQAAARISLSIDGETTGVESVENRQQYDSMIYDLQGRPVTKPVRSATTENASSAGLKKGIYVKEGKKIVIN